MQVPRFSTPFPRAAPRGGEVQDHLVTGVQVAVEVVLNAVDVGGGEVGRDAAVRQLGKGSEGDHGRSHEGEELLHRNGFGFNNSKSKDRFRCSKIRRIGQVLSKAACERHFKAIGRRNSPANAANAEDALAAFSIAHT